MRKIEPKVDEIMVDRCDGPKTKESKKTYPYIRMEHQFFPETKKWGVGKEYTVKMKVKMTGISISKYQNDSEFDIVEFDSGDKKEK